MAGAATSQQALIAAGEQRFPEPVGAPATSVPSSSTATSMSVALPAGIQAGEVLLVFLFSTTTPTGFAISGWTQAFSQPSGSYKLTCLRKDATGSEGSSATMTWTGGTNDIAVISYRIANARLGTNPEIAMLASTTGSSTSTNPPNLAPSWGSAKALWFVAVLLSSSRTLTWPAAYNPGVGDAANTATDPKLYMRGRQNEAASEDPAAITWTTGLTSTSATIGIRPA